MADPARTAPVAAVVVAAGGGTRAAAGADPGAPPKQYAPLAGRPLLVHALAPFCRHPAIGRVVVVIAEGDRARYAAAIDHLAAGERARLAAPALGGASRQASVRAGLDALAADPPALVLIHDAARPFVTETIIDRVLAALQAVPAALPVLAVTDTVKRLAGGRVTATLPREALGLAQTPQGFAYREIAAAHARAAGQGGADFTDDAAIAEWAGLAVAAVPGEAGNVKVTTAADLAAARARAAAATGSPLVTLVGFGFDVHAFGPGERVRLAGIDVPHDRGLVGHSDADVALHALADAIYGALGEGDIGVHFPPDDPRWKGADSSRFVADAAARVAARGGRIGNADLTVICERPKIGPHRAAMAARVSDLLGGAPAGVKATTTERLGFAGRGEGIAAQAAVTVLLPPRAPGETA